MTCTRSEQTNACWTSGTESLTSCVNRGVFTLLYNHLSQVTKREALHTAVFKGRWSTHKKSSVVCFFKLLLGNNTRENNLPKISSAVQIVVITVDNVIKLQVASTSFPPCLLFSSNCQLCCCPLNSFDWTIGKKIQTSAPLTKLTVAPPTKRNTQIFNMQRLCWYANSHLDWTVVSSERDAPGEAGAPQV